MIAPKAPGHRVREVFTEGSGVPALVAIHQDASGKARMLSPMPPASGACAPASSRPPSAKRPKAICSASSPCSAAASSELIRAGFETLVEAGYAPEIAYFECLHELKLIVDLIYEGGLNYMRFSVSDTAEYGDYTRGPRIVNDQTRAEMKKILSEIQSGEFAREWMAENKAGREQVPRHARSRSAISQIEHVGSELREMMPFLKKKKEAGVPQEAAAKA